ncbi:MAG: hypothetical protein ACLUNV_08485 [Sutterella wadsworthensis]
MTVLVLPRASPTVKAIGTPLVTKTESFCLDDAAIATFAQIFDSDPEAPILPNIHCQSMLSILEKFGACSLRLNSISDELTISSMWHETGARLDGTIKEFSNHRTPGPE